MFFFLKYLHMDISARIYVWMDVFVCVYIYMRVCVCMCVPIEHIQFLLYAFYFYKLFILFVLEMLFLLLLLLRNVNKDTSRLAYVHPRAYMQSNIIVVEFNSSMHSVLVKSATIVCKL